MIALARNPSASCNDDVSQIALLRDRILINDVCSTGSILSLPFRRSVKLSLASTIHQYINSKYDQHPDMFKKDLEVIDALRQDAINVREPHLSGVKKLQAYIAQLSWISGKFPIDVSRARRPCVQALAAS